ncbi:MAG TPA: serine/threonine-protein kinase [Actinomycetota bacterium]|jgi:serine/threonine-protein kinase
MGVRLAIGEEFAGHRIERRIGRGGMGVVYVAEHLRLGRKVAIKVLDPELAGDETSRQRFIRESRLAAGLDHPNIVQVYDAGEVGDVAYISMRLVDGSDMAALLRSERTLALDRTLSIGGQVARALDAAHAAGLVHRDVKPANILLSPPDAAGRERAFLTDFGITKLVAGERTTETGQFIGTIDYMAPEQIRGDLLDGRADQYSLACVLFQCVSGRPPFRREEQIAVLYAHLHDSPPQLTTPGADLPPAVVEAIRRGMAKRPDSRFTTCSEMVDAAAVVAVATGPAPGLPTRGRAPRPTTHLPGRRGGRHRQRRRHLVAAGLASIVILLGGAIGTVLAMQPGAGRGPGPEIGAGTRTGTTGQTGSTGSSVSTGPGGPDIFPQEIAWRRIPDPQLRASGHQMINRATVSGGEIVAVGDQGPPDSADPAIWTSNNDGTTWSTYRGEGGPGDQEMIGVVHTDHGYVAVGTFRVSARQNGGVWTSTNGIIWLRQRRDLGPLAGANSQVLRRLIYVRHLLVGIGVDHSQSPQVAAAWFGQWSDGVWQWSGSPLRPDPHGAQDTWGVAPWLGSIVVVGSSTDTASDDMDPAVWIGSDLGANWRRVGVQSLAETGNQEMDGVVAAGTGLLAVGRDGDRAAVWTSPDGRTWHEQKVTPSIPVADITGVIAYRGGYVMYGAAGTEDSHDAAIWTSPDGENWTPSTSPDLVESNNQLIKTMVVSGDRLVAAGIDQGGNGGDAAVWVGTPVEAPASPSPQPSAD